MPNYCPQDLKSVCINVHASVNPALLQYCCVLYVPSTYMYSVLYAVLCLCVPAMHTVPWRTMLVCTMVLYVCVFHGVLCLCVPWCTMSVCTMVHYVCVYHGALCMCVPWCTISVCTMVHYVTVYQGALCVYLGVLCLCVPVCLCTCVMCVYI